MRPLLAKHFSQNSVEIFNAATRSLRNKDSEETLSMLLQVIAVAKTSEKISVDEAHQLKREILERKPFDRSIVAKLTRIERMILLDYQNEELDPEQASEETATACIKEIQLVDTEIDTLKRVQSERPVDSRNSFICWCCHDIKSDAKDGVSCAEGHFQCNECLTHWTEVMNVQATENSDLFRSRGGQITCKYDDCGAPPYSRTVMCNHLLDERVSEGYLQGLQSIEIAKAQVLYQERLAEAIREARAEIESRMQATSPARVLDDSQPNKVPETGELQNPSIASLESNKDSLEPEAPTIIIESSRSIMNAPTRAELEALAESLRLQMPDARMCPQCSFGPVVHRACDDLRSHNGEQVGESSMINNACPQCSWFGDSWSDWLPWNGYFTESLNQGAFKLGSGDSTNAEESTISTVDASLSPLEQEMKIKEKRLKLLEAAQEQARLASEAQELKRKEAQAAKLAAAQPPKVPDSAMTKEQLAEHQKIQEIKERNLRLKEQELKKKKERELLLKQMKADRR